MIRTRIIPVVAVLLFLGAACAGSRAGSFYDVNTCDIAPGCPTANWGNVDGYWWYVNARSDATDLVICAPECAGSFVPAGACLRLPSGQ